MARVIRLVTVIRFAGLTRPSFKRWMRAEFDVWRYADTDDGRRLLVQSDRGISQFFDRGNDLAYWRSLSPQRLLRSGVGELEDEPIPGREVAGPELYWQATIEALAEQGIVETVDTLADLPTTAELDPELTALLEAFNSPNPPTLQAKKEPYVVTLPDWLARLLDPDR